MGKTNPIPPHISGLIGATRRWGPRRVVRLDALTPEQRRLVLALVDAARAEASREDPPNAA